MKSSPALESFVQEKKPGGALGSLSHIFTNSLWSLFYSPEEKVGFRNFAPGLSTQFHKIYQKEEAKINDARNAKCFQTLPI